MIRPKRLQAGDKIGVVSLSWGGLGDPALLHKYHLAKERLEGEFGLTVVPMEHALKGSAFLAEHPALRAKDLMAAFLDPTIAGVFCAIGGSDTIRLLPHIDFSILRENPKVFLGYSDSTINHFMMQRAGLLSFYGPAVMSDFGEYGEMFAYTKEAVRALLFGESAGYIFEPSPSWSPDWVPWCEENLGTRRTLIPDTHGYELLQGTGKVVGRLLGGCLDVFVMCMGTSIWPTLEEWRGAVLFLETSEDKPSPETVTYLLRGLAAQGILGVVGAILFGKPQGEVHYEAYKAALLQVVAKEVGRPELPILYNLNFGHGVPIGVLPVGGLVEVDCEGKGITLLESATV